VTAVASAEPHTDEELQLWARPGREVGTPAGVAVGRVIRHFGAHPRFQQERLDIGLAVGSATAKPLGGRLTGAFVPGRFAYEVRFRPTNMVRAGEGETTVSVSFSSDDPNTIFSTVPDADGRFDFGALEYTDDDAIAVECFALSEADEGVADTPFSGAIVSLVKSKDGVEIPLQGRRVVTLQAMTAEGQPMTMASGNEIEFTIWDERGSEMNWTREEPKLREPLPDGTYLARAVLGERASALTPFTLAGAGEAPEIALVLQPCAPFTVTVVDQNGAALPTLMFLKLGNEASAAFPAPRRVSAFCKDSAFTLQGLLPDTYDVEFRGGTAPPFVRRLELKPGGEPVVVTVP